MQRAASWLDFRLASGGVARGRKSLGLADGLRWLPTRAGTLRAIDTGGDKPCVLIVPDGPNVVEHYAELLDTLSRDWRVVCFDMPGFGFSVPSPTYDHSLAHGAAAVLEVMDQLGLAKATLAFSCANGFYARRVAQLAPHRVEHLLLSQTPSLEAMHRWAERTVPRLLHWPLAGQLAARVLRQKMAQAWYRLALPQDTDGAAMRQQGRRALQCGCCFSLAGVVQGLMREPVTAVQGLVQPSTLLWGAKDRSHRLTPLQSLRADSPQAVIVVLPNCGHFPDLEDPSRFAQTLAGLRLSHD